MCSCTTHGADCGFSVRCAVCGVEELLYLDISHKIKADLLLWNTSTFTLLSEEPGEIAKFRAESWVFQQTFKTPLKELNRFVSISFRRSRLMKVFSARTKWSLNPRARFICSRTTHCQWKINTIW